MPQVGARVCVTRDLLDAHDTCSLCPLGEHKASLLARTLQPFCGGLEAVRRGKESGRRKSDLPPDPSGRLGARRKDREKDTTTRRRQKWGGAWSKNPRRAEETRSTRPIFSRHLRTMAQALHSEHCTASVALASGQALTACFISFLLSFFLSIVLSRRTSRPRKPRTACIYPRILALHLSTHI